MAKHDTIRSIMAELSKRSFQPRQLVYADSDKGKVEIVVNNVLGDNGRTFTGEPFVVFSAYSVKYDKSVLLPSLVEALNYIGIVRSDSD